MTNMLYGKSFMLAPAGVLDGRMKVETIMRLRLGQD
jgi:hypothetical protein